MDPFTLSLASPDLSLSNAGGKGRNLGRLIAGGFPTPGGFVITTTAYRAFVESNGLLPEIARHSAATDPARPETYDVASQALRLSFERGFIPDGVEAAVRVAYEQWPGQPAVAVRSSATAEDLPEASFAGQQDTYLHIVGVADVLTAVKRCWGSLWTARAMAYRARQGLAPESVALAVVVQPLVDAESAGVLFTLNPVSGRRDEQVINATWGLGEALVSGRVNPDTVTVDRDTGAIKDLVIGDKEWMTSPAAAGTTEEKVTDERRGQAVLTPEQAVELARLGREIESSFGAPQDIEWAIADGRIAILQSRPITTYGGVPGDDAWPPLAPATAQPFDLWTQSDMGERWPEPVTPLTWSVWEALTNESMRATLKVVPSDLPRRTQWVRRAYGRVYMNEGAMMHLYTRELGMPASRVAVTLGSQTPPATDAQAGRWNWGIVLRRLPVWLTMMRTMQTEARRFEADFPTIDAWVDDFMRRDLNPMSDAALWAEGRDTWRQRVLEYIQYHTSVTGMSSSYLSMLEDLAGNWLGDRSLGQTLLVGLSGVIQAEMVPMLQGLAQTCRVAGLDALIRDVEPTEALARLRATPAAAPLLAQLNTFLQRHGHRCATEAEWLYPRWIEAPELVVGLIQGYLTNAGAPAAADGESRQRQRRAEAEAQAAARLDPFRRGYFKWVLEQAQQLMRLRDNGQGYLVRLMLPWRVLVAELGRRWAGRGWLNAVDDVFFLAEGEIEAALSPADADANGPTLKDRVRERRRAYHHWFSVVAPEVLDAAGQPVAAPVPSADSADVLSGIAASSGRVTGVARLVASPREAIQLQPGEILVTRATDPGWTPVFSLISGVVLEVGGPLSHGAIVAREYGLPAVVNVPGALQRIRDGQTITVDGAAGRVFLT